MWVCVCMHVSAYFGGVRECVRECVCVPMHACGCMNPHRRVSMCPGCAWICVSLCVCAHVCVHGYLCVCTCLLTVCVHACVQLCTHICGCMCHCMWVPSRPGPPLSSRSLSPCPHSEPPRDAGAWGGEATSPPAAGAAGGAGEHGHSCTGQVSEHQHTPG